MEVQINKKFLKDLLKIPMKERIKIEEFVFVNCNKLDSLDEIPSIAKLKGFSHFYRVRFGDYRVGISYMDGILRFERVLHRKEIYRYFP